jgi:hypothetical protein
LLTPALVLLFVLAVLPFLVLRFVLDFLTGLWLLGYGWEARGLLGSGAALAGLRLTPWGRQTRLVVSCSPFDDIGLGTRSQPCVKAKRRGEGLRVGSKWPEDNGFPPARRR